MNTIEVIEWLTFEVNPAERDDWLEVEEQHWSRFLETRAGFAGKQMWVEDGDQVRVHAVIRWKSMEAWKSVSAAEVEAVDAAMGPWLRQPTMRVFRVVRDS